MAAARGRTPVAHGRRGAVVGCLLAVAVGSPASRASDPGPAAPAAVEHAEVRYTTSPAAARPAGTPAAATDAIGDASHVVAALAIVVGLILGLRWVARKLALVPTSRGSRGVRLLSRTVLSPKQQVLLLQVGRRVVVVGDGGAAGMRPLCEITDPDEVAALVGDVKSAEATAASPKSFGNLFKRAAEPFDPDRLPAVGQSPADVPSDVVGLLDKVRGLRQQFDR